jgi:hypothetical protein
VQDAPGNDPGLAKAPGGFIENVALLRKIAEFFPAHRGMLVHGSAIAVDGKGYLFTALSGTGKSTHTRYWREAFGQRAVMINDDKPFLQITQNGVTAFGSPWSGKHGLDTNTSAPLAGICILERGTENRIWHISPEDALPMALKQSYCPLDPSKTAKFEALIRRLTETVPLWRMTCIKDPQAAQVAYSAMETHS